MTVSASEPIALRTIAFRGLLAILGATAINATIVTAALRVPAVEPFGALAYGPVIFATILGAAAATAIYGLLTRVWPSPDDLFVRVAVIALPASFLPTLGVLYADPEATASAVAVLLVMHVTTAIVCVGILVDQYSPIGAHRIGDG